jgi:hypothetical protein
VKLFAGFSRVSGSTRRSTLIGFWFFGLAPVRSFADFVAKEYEI